METFKTATEITIRVLCFAQLKGHLGESEFSLSLPKGATGHDLLERLAERAPPLRPLLLVSRLAVNGEYTSFEKILEEGDEVVVIPPVSGG